MTKHLIMASPGSLTEIPRSDIDLNVRTSFWDLAYSREEIEAADEAWEQAFREGR
jgi:hypothetical protein